MEDVGVRVAQRTTVHARLFIHLYQSEQSIVSVNQIVELIETYVALDKYVAKDVLYDQIKQFLEDLHEQNFGVDLSIADILKLLVWEWRGPILLS